MRQALYRVGQKEQSPTGKKDRLVFPLDIPGREGEGQRMRDLFISGLVKLPTQIVNADTLKKCVDAFRQYLDRYKPWVVLTKQVKGLSPYSLRHSYAWREHKSYSRSISVRDLAAMMGHNPATH